MASLSGASKQLGLPGWALQAAVGLVVVVMGFLATNQLQQLQTRDTATEARVSALEAKNEAKNDAQDSEINSLHIQLDTINARGTTATETRVNAIEARLAAHESRININTDRLTRLEQAVFRTLPTVGALILTNGPLNHVEGMVTVMGPISIEPTAVVTMLGVAVLLVQVLRWALPERVAREFEALLCAFVSILVAVAWLLSSGHIVTWDDLWPMLSLVVTLIAGSAGVFGFVRANGIPTPVPYARDLALGAPRLPGRRYPPGNTAGGVVIPLTPTSGAGGSVTISQSTPTTSAEVIPEDQS